MAKGRTIITASLILLCLSVSSVAYLQPVKCQWTVMHLPQITINKDGSVTPQTSYINQTGNVYKLTANIENNYFIKIECSDIVFEGNEHLINSSKVNPGFVDGYPAEYADPSIFVSDATNVVIKDVRTFANNVYAIYLLNCSQCQVIGVTTDKSQCISISGSSNTIELCNGGVCIFEGNNNQIIRNNVTNLFIGSACQLNRNNFFLSDKPDLTTSNTWDNGSMGNYWSNYTARYPNATEIDHSGRGSTPYIIERADYSTREYPNATNIDNHPLIYPYNIDRDAISFPSVTSTAPEFPQPETWGMTSMIVYIGLSVVIACLVLGLLLYRWHRKRSRLFQ